MFNTTIKNAKFNNLLISVCDVLGKEVLGFSDKNNSVEYNRQINMESLPKGIYYVKLLTDADIKTFKISIQ